MVRGSLWYLHCLVVLVTLFTITKGNQTCITNPTFDDTNEFSKFFDKCFVDSTKVNIFGQVAAQLQTWFNEDNYPVYILVSLLVILFCVVKDSRGNDDMARYNFIRLQGLLLLIRVGLAISITPWMWAAIQQQRPCFCSSGSEVPMPLGGIRWWGMPSGVTFTSTIIGAHIMQVLSIPFGIVWVVIMGAASVSSGQYSFGQTIVGIVLGLVLHLYSIRTPIFMRIVDFFATLIAGFVAIALAMRDYNGFDFSFAVFFLVGLAWQVYAFTMLFVSFEWGFMRKALSQSPHALHDVDFLYFRPLNSHTNDSEPPSFRVESYWTVFLTTVLFIVLCGLKVLAPHLDEDVN